VDTVKVDSAKRVRLPDAKPGQVFAYSADGKGRIVLLEVQTKAGTPEPLLIEGFKPLSKAALDRLYRERREDDESIRLLMDAQAWDHE
jgi:3-methyladenine DNA glycosylase Mpg